jgi:hypothetical protein
MTQVNDAVSTILKPFSDSSILAIVVVAIIAFAIGYIAGRPITYNDHPHPLQKQLL